MLEDEFQALGYRDIGFDFSGQNQRDRPEVPADIQVVTAPVVTLPEPAARAQQYASAQTVIDLSRIDIRL